MKNQKINLIDSKEEPQAEFDQQAVSLNKKRLSKRWFFRCSIFILVLEDE